MEKNKTIPGYKFLLAIHEKFSVNSDWLLTGQGEMFTRKEITIPGRKMIISETKLPYITNIHAGVMSSVVDVTGEYIEVPGRWAEKGDFVIKITGNSMKEEGIINGMLVLIREQDCCNSGDIVLIYNFDRPEEASGVLKKAKILASGNMIFQNGSGEVLELGEKIKIIGRAIDWMTDYNESR